MRSAVLVKKGLFELTDAIAEPSINKKYNTKLKISYCGICGSDISKFLASKEVNYPLILGHEFCGHVVDGPEYLNKEHLYVGKPLINCGQCEFCRSGKYELCINQDFIGSTVPGAMQDYILIRDKDLLDVNELSDEPQLATLVEPLANVIHAYSFIKNKNLRNKKIVIVGNGVMGTMLYSILKIYQPKIQIDVLTKNKEGYGNYYDFCFECSGTIEGWNKAMRAVKSGGMLIQIGIIYANCYDGTHKLNSDLMLRKEITHIGSWNSNFGSDWVDAYNIIKDNRAEFRDLISDIYPLEDINKAFEIKLTTPVKKLILKVEN